VVITCYNYESWRIVMMGELRTIVFDLWYTVIISVNIINNNHYYCCNNAL